MGRIAFKLGILLTILTFASSAVDAKAQRPGCDSPRSLGGWIGGKGDTVDNEIRQIEVLTARDGGEPIGWFYFLKNSAIWFQPNLVMSYRAGQYSVFVPAQVNQGDFASLRIVDASTSAAAQATRSYLRQLKIGDSALPKPIFEFVHNRLLVSTTFCR